MFFEVRFDLSVKPTRTDVPLLGFLHLTGGKHFARSTDFDVLLDEKKDLGIERKIWYLV
jgi:hypothetical protein